MKNIISFSLGAIAGATATAAIMIYQIRDMIQLVEEATEPHAEAADTNEA